MATSGGLRYRVNRHDEIVFVSEQWDAFADANGGAAARSEHVLHKPLRSFVADATTQLLYAQILARAREGRVVAFTFRCDSPGERRLLQMRVSPMDDGDVEFATAVVRAESRPPVSLCGLMAPDGNELIRVCGWCNKVHDGQDWAEVEEALGRLRVLESAPAPRMTHGICETCVRVLRAG